ncbi:hypothetical protein EON64_07270 [archaeon]|nr:MAG: hypothetical protein EON64_07270 [archaeon]
MQEMTVFTHWLLLFALLSVIVNLEWAEINLKAISNEDSHAGHSPHFTRRHCSPPQLLFPNKSQSITAYWINLDSSIERKTHMESVFRKMQLPHVRVPAILAESADYVMKLKSLKKPCKRNTNRDIAVVMSHLFAIHTALYHDPSPASPYALILEDDVRFLFSIDFPALISTAPKDFGVLQLTTSNTEALELLWDQYSKGQQTERGTRYWRKTHWQDTTKNGKTFMYWSAQAYVINKQQVKSFIDDVVTSNAKGLVVGFRIHNSFFPQECRRTRADPCIVSFCLFSDSYIYAGTGEEGGHYVSTIPLVTGGKVGLNSTVHQLEVSAHRAGFTKIRSIASQFRQNLLKGGVSHPFIRLPLNDSTGMC